MSEASLPVAGARAPQPIETHERIHTLDMLRGFALFGILLVNMAFFKSSFYALTIGGTWTSLPDQIATTAIRFFAEGKFFTIFSFLFGLGFAVQLERAEARGARVVPSYLRRLFALLLIGIAHVVLLWYGDILTTYALLGFVLLLFRKRRPRTLLVWSVILMALPFLFTAAIAGLVALLMSSPAFATVMNEQTSDSNAWFAQLAAQAATVYANGSFGAIVVQRLQDYAFAAFGLIFYFPMVLAMFLLGLYAGKRRIFHNITAHRDLLRRMLVWGLGIGLVSNAVYVLTYDARYAWTDLASTLLATATATIGAVSLCFAYISGLALLSERQGWRERLSPLAAVGRMALTNYLLQSLVCTTIFYSYGLGLFGQVGPALGVLLAVVIFALQIPLSVWWLRHFQYGPMEWLWRTLTYLRPPALRRVASGQVRQGAGAD